MEGEGEGALLLALHNLGKRENDNKRRKLFFLSLVFHCLFPPLPSFPNTFFLFY